MGIQAPRYRAPSPCNGQICRHRALRQDRARRQRQRTGGSDRAWPQASLVPAAVLLHTERTFRVFKRLAVSPGFMCVYQ